MKADVLSLKEKIGQMFMISLNSKGSVSKKTIEMIQNYKVGGVILYRKNYETYEEMIEIINELKKANKGNKVPLIISIDQEGGRVSRFPKEQINRLYDAYTVAKTGSIENVEKNSELIAKLCSQSGINMNFAPVLDIKRFEDTQAIGDRCFSEDKEEIIKYGIASVKQYKKNGVIPVIKHFPGHGATQVDSHSGIPVINSSKEDLENNDIDVFKKVIASNQTDAIMVGHLLVKNIDNKYPASFSKKIIEEYLSDYKGIIITDDFKMRAVLLHYNLIKASFRSIDAGANIIMMGLPYFIVKMSINNMIKSVRNKKIDISKIDIGVSKILATKEKYNLNDDEVKGVDTKEINKEIDDLNNKIKKA